MSSRVSGDTLVIRVPYSSSSSSIQDFVDKSIEWAKKRGVKKFESYKVMKDSLIPILGNSYKIEGLVKSSRNKVEIEGNLLNIKFTKSPEESLILYLKKQLKDYVNIASTDYAEEIGESFNKITIKKVSTIWGSCSSKQNLNYNYKLALCPLWIIDYVAAHEVCHLKHKNHSKTFWNLVENIYPNYKKAKKWLNENGNNLNLS